MESELPRERAASSSEPCSTRPNPFYDEPSSRKRQRVSRGDSRSRSVDTAHHSEIVPVPASISLQDEASTKAEVDAAPPSTPIRMPSDLPPTEPTSSRVTINLRTARNLNLIPSSPPSPSKMVDRAEDSGTRVSVESESDALSTLAAIETPSSSPSAIGSPPVEVLAISEDDGDFEVQSPPVAILDGDSLYSDYDPMLDFPCTKAGESPIAALRKIASYFQWEEILNDEAFCKLRDWVGQYLQFANDIEKCYQSYLRNREFWQVFPEILWALNSRSRFFGQFLQKSQESRKAMADMFCQFARVAGRFVAMDIETISNQAQTQVPDLGSKGFLAAYSFLLRKDERAHIGHNLEQHYDWNWDETTTLMSTSFQLEGGTLENLITLAKIHLDMIKHNPKAIDSLVDPCRIAAKLVYEAASIFDDPHRSYIESPEQQISRGYEFFLIMSAGLDSIIEKHVTFLTPDTTLTHVSCLTNILKHTLACDSSATRELVDARVLDHPTISRKHFPKVISHEWRFGVLKKLITSTQMQLRVIGVTTMCTDLLHLFNTAKGDDATRSPILRFFANFVIKNKLVDYIVGIGSHPELINESSNILGFLIATKTYTPELTDRIWQTVMSSQDPRVVEAILRMLRVCVHLYEYHALLYICRKASDLPIETFNLPMREFWQNVFQHLVTKSVPEGIPCVDAPPYDLCVRLIRESAIAPEPPLDLQNWAAGRFRDLLNNGPARATRHAIYLACIKDMSSKATTAPGSVLILNVLMKVYGVTDLRILTADHGLTKLLIEELVYTVAEGQTPSLKMGPVGHARQELIHFIMVQEPGTITPDLGRQLWDHLVGSESKTLTDRTSAWMIFNAAVKKYPQNEFIDTCLRDYLPSLPPHCLTPGALEFAKAGVLSWLEEASSGISDEQSFESHALEQIWKMILTAPPNTIDVAAISILVEVFVSSSPITSMSRPKARIIHLAFVTRCLQQLAGAASKLKSFGDCTSSGDEDGMVIVPSESQFQDQERTFARSLAVLREFLKAYQMKPHFATPKPRGSVASTPSKVQGEPLTVRYQSFDGNTHTEVRTLTIGKLNTAAALFASLQQATGFHNYKVYCGGKEFDPNETEVCKALQDLNLNGLVLVQRRGDADGFASADGSKTSLELEIMTHFEELWGYLSMHEKVAQEIYTFLIKFPVSDRLLRDFEDHNMAYTEVFPRGQPFKSLYAIYALRDYITSQSLKVGSVKEKSLTKAISLLVAAISDQDILATCPSDELKYGLATHFIDCLIQFLREPILPTSVATYLDKTLLQRLLQLLSDARSFTSTQHSVQLASRVFEALLEASLHNSDFWGSFVSHLNTGTLLRELLLDDPRPTIRKSAMKQIVNKCTFSPSLAQVSTMDFMIAFWPKVSELIPEAVNNPGKCDEIFNLAHTLFKQLAETSIDFLNLGDLANDWGSLLLDHDCIESVGHPESIDLVAHGLTNLLFCVASFAKASGQALSCSRLGTMLFQKHLFPETHFSAERPDDEIITPNIPLLHPTTRRVMCDAIFFLVKDDRTEYENILKNLGDLVSYDETIDDGPYLYELPDKFERAKSIRSQTGYVGLRNLSNTCYLNSLFTQLFMNIPFRKFMLSAPIADGGASQRLLSETQLLFANMQNSLTRFVDPQNLAGSIRTYEETPIDISVQMDVDEFYNLLFDRWESQILAPDAKKLFRSFYSGQLVQQVKSKECSHISERLEVFSAIQCDIKGKSSLQESLQAYVDGEVMEGDNKYKCSTCDLHVDAVKRACLKDIPDNLIFHLKRFDFNLRTLQRSKINDYFAFPDKIDMRPYKVEHLMDSPEEISEDVFELVGILVHAGTAESGHYYSFIRERPSTSNKDNWVEFNDDSVTPWDPACTEAACFGGVDYRGPVDTGNMSFDKSYSAYMLFYQRSSALGGQKQDLEKSGMSSPIRLPVPAVLSNQIAVENETLMRRYCLFDPSHVNFVSKILSNVKNINRGQCSESHSLEKLALFVAMHHLDQIVSRTKDLPEFPSFLLAIRQICNSCPECTRDFLDWFCVYPDTLRQMFLRNPDVLVRTEIGGSIVSALQKVKDDLPYAYGLDDEESVGNEDDIEANPQLIQRIVNGLDRIWEVFHHNTRAWPEYFGLLKSIANMGKLEAVLLLDAGYLRRTLEIVTADHNLPLTPQLSRMLNIITKRMPTRPVSQEAIISLLSKLLAICDPVEEMLHDNNSRLDLARNSDLIPLTGTEREMIIQHWTRSKANILVEKLLILHQNQQAVKEIMVSLFLWSDGELDTNIYFAIYHGIRKGTSAVLIGPFLKAALTYIQHTDSSRTLALLDHISKTAGNLENHEGMEFLRFFKAVGTIPYTNSDMDRAMLEHACLDRAPTWGPGLLTYYDHEVRVEAEEFLSKKIYGLGPEPDFGSDPEGLRKSQWVLKLGQQLGHACLVYLDHTYVQPRQQAVTSILISILAVIGECNLFFDSEEDDVLTQEFLGLHDSVLPALKKLTVEEVDEEVSDWAGSEDEYDSADPMGDSIAELSGHTDDLNDQL